MPAPTTATFEQIQAKAQHLKAMRKAAEISQSELGARLGWTIRRNHGCSTVSHYESGRKNPSLELIARWATACGFIPELVFTHKDNTDEEYIMQLTG